MFQLRKARAAALALTAAAALSTSACAGMTDQNWDTLMLATDIAVLAAALESDCYSTRDAYGYERYACHGDNDRDYTRGPGRNGGGDHHRPHRRADK